MRVQTIILPFEKHRDLEVFLDREGADVQILGYFVGRGQEQLALNLKIIHRAPHTKARIWIRGVLKDKASCSFKGLIKVEKSASLTDSYLSDHTLLLSDGARAESVPSLEIGANDVKASHGATLGRLDENQLFYLRSRGLDENQSRRLLVQGFFEPILKKMSDENEKARLREKIQYV